MKAALFALLVLPLAGAALAGAPDGREPCPDPYRVARHDTLYSIAHRCGGSVAGIAAANRIADPRRLEVGQLVALGCGGEEDAAKPGEQAGRGYAMRDGDTLFSLARWARVGLPTLLAANPGIDPHKIEIGDLVRLPRGAARPELARLREWGQGPGPAAALRTRPARLIVPPPPPRVVPPPSRAVPPPPPRPEMLRRRAHDDMDKPDEGPQGM